MSECETVSVEEAGRMLGLSRNGAYNAAKRGEIPTLRFGKKLVVPLPQLREMLDGKHPNGGDTVAA